MSIKKFYAQEWESIEMRKSKYIPPEMLHGIFAGQTSQPDERTEKRRNCVHFTLSGAAPAARQTGAKPDKQNICGGFAGNELHQSAGNSEIRNFCAICQKI